MTSARLVSLTVAALIGMIVLTSLGVWQLQRMAWKQELLETLQTRAVAEPVDLADVVARWARAGRPGDMRFLRVRASGRFRHGDERHLYTVLDGKAGWRVITPLETADGSVVLADRGFVPEELKDPSRRGDGAPKGQVTVIGLLRLGDVQAMFTPDNDVAGNQWFWRDLVAMRASLPGGDSQIFAPFFLELEKNAHDGPWPRARPLSAAAIHNRHFSYALTWFGLAAALLVVYGLVLRARSKG